ncbi:hypothetical protein SLA2020_347540 [Shorea laevis]
MESHGNRQEARVIRVAFDGLIHRLGGDGAIACFFSVSRQVSWPELVNVSILACRKYEEKCYTMSIITSADYAFIAICMVTVLKSKIVSK